MKLDYGGNNMGRSGGFMVSFVGNVLKIGLVCVTLEGNSLQDYGKKNTFFIERICLLAFVCIFHLLKMY